MKADQYYPMPSLLADWLKEAKEYHTGFEKSHGPDPKWENWYALYLRYRMDGKSAHQAMTDTIAVILSMPAVK